MRLLVIEDDQRIANLLRQGLEEEGYQVVVASDGRSGLDLGRTEQFDMIILDLMLPQLDGNEVARSLREEGNRTPILMLTARDSNQDIIRGLNLGADDYITKPFSLDVFLARVRAVSRRGPIPTPAILRVGDLDVDPAAHVVSRAGRAIPLTPREFTLLELLARSSPRVITRQAILEGVWGYHSEVSANNVEAFVSALRSKIDTAGGLKLIHTIRGVGYCLKEEVS
jgi:two-component system copper resistance phosphate regulon response regulator CusR